MRPLLTAALVLALLLIDTAFAQQPTSGLPPAPSPPTELSVKLSITHWNLILEKLRKQPYEEVADIIAAIVTQGQQQGAGRPSAPTPP